MELSTVDGLLTLKIDLVMTLALAALSLFSGLGLQQRLGFLSRFSIPAPAVGGFCSRCWSSRCARVGRSASRSMRRCARPLQTAFFTTIGLGATLTLLRAGGWRTGFFWLIASASAVVQNLIGIGVAFALGAPLALGIICGALTLSGGPATGLAFTPDFERLGIPGAGALIIASATFGIFVSSLVGNPVVSALIKRFRLAPRREAENVAPGENIIADIADEAARGSEAGILSVNADKIVTRHDPLVGYVLLRHLAIILAVMGVGALVSMALTRLSVALPDEIGRFLRLPGYIGAMIVAAIARNLDDRLYWLRIDNRVVEALARLRSRCFSACADGFEVVATGRAGSADLVILIAQVAVMIAYALLVTFVLMGRDYEAAVTASGHIGSASASRRTPSPTWKLSPRASPRAAQFSRRAGRRRVLH